jgi:hypothetical protein
MDRAKLTAQMEKCFDPHPDAPSCLLPSQNQQQCINTKGNDMQ